jgi:hypothetical protein
MIRRMMSPAGRSVRPLQRAAALLCAVAYLSGGTEVFPVALALGALLEGSHTVRVARDGAEVTIVLSHERGQLGRPDYTPRHQPGNARHRHGTASRLVCAFAARQPHQTDHVAGFTTTSVCENSSRPLKANAASAPHGFLASATTVTSLLLDGRALETPALISFSARPADTLRLLR